MGVFSLPGALRAAAFYFACAAPQGAPLDAGRAVALTTKAYRALGELESLSDAQVPRWVKLAIVTDRDEHDLETLRARSQLCELLAGECERLEL